MWKLLVCVCVCVHTVHACSCDNDCERLEPCFKGVCLEGSCGTLVDLNNTRCVGFTTTCTTCEDVVCPHGSRCDRAVNVCACVRESPTLCTIDLDCALFAYGDCVQGHCARSGVCTALAEPSCGSLAFSTPCAPECVFLGAPISACLCPPVPVAPCETYTDCGQAACYHCIESQCAAIDSAACEGQLGFGFPTLDAECQAIFSDICYFFFPWLGCVRWAFGYPQNTNAWCHCSGQGDFWCPACGSCAFGASPVGACNCYLSLPFTYGTWPTGCERDECVRVCGSGAYWDFAQKSCRYPSGSFCGLGNMRC